MNSPDSTDNIVANLRAAGGIGGALFRKRQPVRNVRELDAAAIAETFAVDTMAPAQVLKHLLALLARNGRAARRLWCVIARLAPNDSGEFCNYPGKPVPG